MDPPKGLRIRFAATHCEGIITISSFWLHDRFTIADYYSGAVQQPGRKSDRHHAQSTRIFMQKKSINDTGTEGLSRQRRYQIRNMRKGLCILCGKTALEETVWCLDHHLKKGTRRPGRNKSRMKKWIAEDQSSSAVYHPVFLEG